MASLIFPGAMSYSLKDESFSAFWVRTVCEPFIVQPLSCVWLFATPWTAAHQASLSFTFSQSLLKLIELVMLCNSLILCCPLLLLPSIFPSISLFQWIGSPHQIAKVLEFQLQHQSFQWIFRVVFLQVWPVWSPCSPGDSQESSPAPQFKSINPSALILLCGPTLISVHG